MDKSYSSDWQNLKKHDNTFKLKNVKKLSTLKKNLVKWKMYIS